MAEASPPEIRPNLYEKLAARQAETRQSAYEGGPAPAARREATKATLPEHTAKCAGIIPCELRAFSGENAGLSVAEAASAGERRHDNAASN